jgi:hypothetical protein
VAAVEDDDKSLLTVEDDGSISLLVSILGEVMGVDDDSSRVDGINDCYGGDNIDGDGDGDVGGENDYEVNVRDDVGGGKGRGVVEKIMGMLIIFETG